MKSDWVFTVSGVCWTWLRPDKHSKAHCVAMRESVSVQRAKAGAVQDFSSGCVQTACGREGLRCTMVLCSLCCTSVTLTFCPEDIHSSSSFKLTQTHAHTCMHAEEFSPRSWEDRGQWLDAPNWVLQCSPSLKHAHTSTRAELMSFSMLALCIKLWLLCCLYFNTHTRHS